MSENNNTENDKTMRRIHGRFLKIFATSQAIAIVILILLCVCIFEYFGGLGFRHLATIFNWHPLLMIVAFVVCQANAILIYRVMRFRAKRSLKIAHACLNAAAVIAASGATVAVVVYHHRANFAHLYSLHSWLGTLTITVFVLQYIASFIVFLYPAKVSLRNRMRLMPYHRFGGIAVFIAAVATAFTGLNEKAIFSLNGSSLPAYSTYPVVGILINVIALLLVVYAGMIAYLVTKPEFTRIPLSELAQRSNTHSLQAKI